MTTLHDYVELAKIEILEDARNSPRFYIVQSFAELHDLCDANMYGGAPYILDELGMEKATALLNAGAEELDRWIKSGQMRTEARQMIREAAGEVGEEEISKP